MKKLKAHSYKYTPEIPNNFFDLVKVISVSNNKFVIMYGDCCIFNKIKNEIIPRGLNTSFSEDDWKELLFTSLEEVEVFLGNWEFNSQI